MPALFWATYGIDCVLFPSTQWCQDCSYLRLLYGTCTDEGTKVKFKVTQLVRDKGAGCIPSVLPQSLCFNPCAACVVTWTWGLTCFWAISTGLTVHGPFLSWHLSLLCLCMSVVTWERSVLPSWARSSVREPWAYALHWKALNKCLSNACLRPATPEASCSTHSPDSELRNPHSNTVR